MKHLEFLALFLMQFATFYAIGLAYREISKQLKKEREQMAIDRKTFGTDLAALITAIGNLITAVNNKIAATPAEDFTPEDASVQQAAADIAKELTALSPPPAQVPPPVTPPPTTPPTA